MYQDLDACVQGLKDLITTNAGSLGVNYVSYGEEKKRPSYPAVMVVGALTERTYNETAYFMDLFYVNLFILHEKLQVGKSQRNKEDLLLVKGLVRLLHLNKNMGLDGSGKKNLISSFVMSEEPGRLAGPEGEVAVGTRIVWQGRQTEPLTPA